MRLDVANGDAGWPCYDAKRCCMVERVMWVDDQTATWGELVSVWFEPTVHQEERITIYPSRRLVIFNQVDDEAGDGEQVSDAVTRALETT